MSSTYPESLENVAGRPWGWFLSFCLSVSGIVKPLGKVLNLLLRRHSVCATRRPACRFAGTLFVQFAQGPPSALVALGLFSQEACALSLVSYPSFFRAPGISFHDTL